MTKFYTSRSAVRSIKAQTASYLQSRLQPLSLLGATSSQLAPAFALHHQSKNTSGNIQINYLTAKGESVTYTHCVTKTDTLGNAFCLLMKILTGYVLARSTSVNTTQKANTPNPKVAERISTLRLFIRFL